MREPLRSVESSDALARRHGVEPCAAPDERQPRQRLAQFFAGLARFFHLMLPFPDRRESSAQNNAASRELSGPKFPDERPSTAENVQTIILAALNKLADSRHPDMLFSAHAIADAANIPLSAVLHFLPLLIAAGYVERIENPWDGDGQRTGWPGYRITLRGFLELRAVWP